MTENEKEKKTTDTVNINIQHGPAIPFSPSNASTGNFKRNQITQLLDTKQTNKKFRQQKRKANTAKGSSSLTVLHKNTRGFPFTY